MTNNFAVGLGIFVLAFIGLSVFLDLGWHVFLARRFLDLIDFLAFWR